MFVHFYCPVHTIILNQNPYPYIHITYTPHIVKLYIYPFTETPELSSCQLFLHWRRRRLRFLGIPFLSPYGFRSLEKLNNGVLFVNDIDLNKGLASAGRGGVFLRATLKLFKLFRSFFRLLPQCMFPASILITVATVPGGPAGRYIGISVELDQLGRYNIA